MENIYKDLMGYVNNYHIQDSVMMNIIPTESIFFKSINDIPSMSTEDLTGFIRLNIDKIIDKAYKDSLINNLNSVEISLFMDPTVTRIIATHLNNRTLYLASYNEVVKLNQIIYALRKQVSLSDEVINNFIKIANITESQYTFSFYKFSFSSKYGNFLAVARESSFNLNDCVIRVDRELVSNLEFTPDSIKRKSSTFPNEIVYISTLITTLFNMNDWYIVFPMLMLDCPYYNTQVALEPALKLTNKAITYILNMCSNIEEILNFFNEYYSYNRNYPIRYSIQEEVKNNPQLYPRLTSILPMLNTYYYIP